MAGTGKKGYTGVTSDGRVISNGIIQSGGSSGGSSGPGGSSSGSSSSGGARVSKETYDNGQPKYVYTSSGKEVPTYGYRVVQRGADGNLYDINNGVVSNINGGGGYKVGTSADDRDSTIKNLASTIVNTAKNPLSNVASAITNAAKGVASALYGNGTAYPDEYGDYGGSGGSGGGSGGSGGYGTIDPETQALKDKLEELESNKPGAYSNGYESQIQSILNGILNKKAFDINTDANYKTLYDLYNQSYTQNANRAARDAMGQLAAMTGGYGNTYAQTAGSQAYDTVMQGMNDNNINLANLAYDMYRFDRDNEYSQLAALTGLEQSDYAKYLDTLSDYYNDLNHYTNRYNTAWGQDYQLNRDEIEDARYAEELAYAREQAAQERALAKEALDYEREWNEDQRNYNRSQDAFTQALSLAKQGYNTPDYLANTMNTYTGSTGLSDLANGIAATVQALNAPQTSGGGSGGGRSGGSKSSGAYDNGAKDNDRSHASFVKAISDYTKRKTSK